MITKKCNTITDLQLDGGNLTDEGVEMISEVRSSSMTSLWHHDDVIMALR